MTAGPSPVLAARRSIRSAHALSKYIVIAAALLAVPAAAFAQTDEIQVYDGSIAEPGVINLMLHNNYTPDGRKSPAFPGGLTPDKSYNGVAEWAFGVTPWFEAGVYLPLYSISKDRGATFDGSKIRLLFAEQHAAERAFVYAVNFELSFNADCWDPYRITSEIRPILGWHVHSWDFFVNPIFDTNYTGGFANLDFAPASRIAYNFLPKWALAVEEYADLGPLHNLYSGDQQSHQFWAVFDHSAKWVDLEGGIGFGLTPASDKVTIKLMLSRDIHRPNKH